MSENINVNQEKLIVPQVQLTDKDLLGSWLRWLSFASGFVNYERMQGVGFAHAMSPVIVELYPNKEDRIKALQRHLVFYNTNVTTGSIILGLVIAMEEEKANGADITGESINAVKVSLMGPLAGLGDSIFQATVIPIALSIGIALGLQGNVMGPIIFTILVLGIIYPLDFWWFKKSYKEGKPLLNRLMQSGLLKKVTQGASMVGLLAAGTLTARYINFKILTEIPLSVGDPINIQADILDKIAPNLLPILLVLGIWAALRKQVSTGKIMAAIFVLGLLAGVLGIL